MRNQITFSLDYPEFRLCLQLNYPGGLENLLVDTPENLQGIYSQLRLSLCGFIARYEKGSAASIGFNNWVIARR